MEKSRTFRVSTPCGVLTVTITNNGKMRRVMCRMGKSGCKDVIMQTMGIMISNQLKAGVEPKRIISDIEGHDCGQNPTTYHNEKVVSCVDGIAKAMRASLDY